MISKPDDLLLDLVSVLAALKAEHEAWLRADAMAAIVQTELSDKVVLIAHFDADREAQARTVRAALRAHGAADRRIGTGA